MALCTQSDLQVVPTDPVGETTCPACGATVVVPKASPATVWPELRTRWPSHARPEDHERREDWRIEKGYELTTGPHAFLGIEDEMAQGYGAYGGWR